MLNPKTFVPRKGCNISIWRRIQTAGKEQPASIKSPSFTYLEAIGNWSGRCSHQPNESQDIYYYAQHVSFGQKQDQHGRLMRNTARKYGFWSWNCRRLAGIALHRVLSSWSPLLHLKSHRQWFAGLNVAIFFEANSCSEFWSQPEANLVWLENCKNSMRYFSRVILVARCARFWVLDITVTLSPPEACVYLAVICVSTFIALSTKKSFYLPLV